MTRRSFQGRAAAALLLGSGQARETGDGSLRTAYPTAISGTLRQRGLASARCSAGRSLRESSRNRRRELSPERHHGRTVAVARAGPGRVLVDDQPARWISLRTESAFSNSTLTTAHASALQRVCSITRRTRLMRSQGWQRRASACLTGSAHWDRSPAVLWHSPGGGAMPRGCVPGPPLDRFPVHPHTRFAS